MIVQDVSFVAVFLFGVLSIISPCVIVLLPVYLATITGLSVHELRDAADQRAFRRRVFSNALGFILGFFLIFIPLGALIGVAAERIGEAREVVAVVAGVVVILLGINFLYPLPFLRWTQREARIRWRPRAYTFIGNLFFGVTFAFVWTPCVGPFLLGVVALVGQTGDIGRGVGFFSLYSFGLATALLTLAFFFGKLIYVTEFVKKHHQVIEIVSGILLIAIGLLMITNQLYITNVAINRILNNFQPENWFIK